MDIENLIQQFENFDTQKFDAFRSIISSKSDDKIFPPYIPHIGKDYSEHKIMMYGMAQNINKPWDELINMSKTEKVRQMYDAKTHNHIWIAPYRIMLSIAGMYLYAKHNISLMSLGEVHNYVSATNYYKFSFNAGGKDINPERDLHKYLSSENYRAYTTVSDVLAMSEIKLLKPKLVISFKGRHIQEIRKAGYETITINDPSWILQGHSGVLKKEGSWYKKIDDSIAQQLVNSYIDQLDNQYAGKKEAVKIYLLKYYDDWKKSNQSFK